MTWRTLLWIACVATEVGALVAAARWRWWTTKTGANYSKVLHLRDLVRVPDGALVVLLACAIAIDLTLGFTDPLDRSAWSFGLNALAASGPRPRTPLVRLAYHLADGLAMAWPLAVAWASGRVFNGQAGQVLGTPSSSPTQRHGEGCPGGKKQEPPHSSGAPHVSEGIGFAPGLSGFLGLSLSSRPKSSFMGGSSRNRGAVDILAGLFIGLVIGMATSYPLRPGLTRWLLWAWEAVCVAAAWVGVARGWPGRGGAVETAAIVLVACETMVATVGPFLTDPFTRWWIATAFYFAAFAAVGVVLARNRRVAS